MIINTRLILPIGFAMALHCGAGFAQAPPPEPGGPPPPPEAQQGMAGAPRKPAPPPRQKPDGPRRPKPENQLAAPAQITNLEEWRKADQAFLAGKAKLIDLAKRKHQIRENAVGKEGKGGRVDNQDFTPGSIMARRNWREYQTQMDDLLRKERDLRDEVLGLARTAFMARREITPILRARRDELKAADPKANNAAEIERLNAWLSRIDKTQGNPSTGFLGEIIGDEIARDLETPRGGPGGRGHGGRPQPPPDDPRDGPDDGPERGDPGRGREDRFRRWDDENAALRQRVDELENRIKLLEEKLGEPPPKP